MLDFFFMITVALSSLVFTGSVVMMKMATSLCRTVRATRALR